MLHGRDLGRFISITVISLTAAACGNPTLRSDVPFIDIADTEVAEGNDKSTITFRVTLRSDSELDVKASYQTRDITATAGEDYQAMAGEVNIPAASREARIEIPVSGDIDMEPDETFEVILSNPVNARLGKGSATGKIVNDDRDTYAQITKPCAHRGRGTDYPVGNGQRYADLAEIPWASLGPGDTVRIYWRETPYRYKILLSSSGSPGQPIRICGVAGGNGERPVISGENAATPPNMGYPNNYFNRDYKGSFQGLGLITISGDYERKPAHIVIEGLHLQRARKEYSFTNSAGEQKNYGDGAACIRIQAADYVTIRNNELESCGNGIFTMSQGYNEASLTRNLLIEGNHLHDNGEPDSYYQHNLYIQAIGVTYQYNHFGPNVSGSLGATLKERVAGSVIRYNWFDSGSTRVMDLVEVEDAAAWYIEREYRDWARANGKRIEAERLTKVQQAEKAYRKTHVYGNFIRHIGSQTRTSNLIHYGWDNEPRLARAGTLYFFNNTLFILNDRPDSWRIGLFDMYAYDEAGGVAAQERVEAFNNIIYVASETSGAQASYLCLGRASGTINLGANWISEIWMDPLAQAECYPNASMRPLVTGSENLITTSGAPIPVDPGTLQPQDSPWLRNRAQQLPDEIRDTHPVRYQYRHHQMGEPRPAVTTPGAMELR